MAHLGLIGLGNIGTGERTRFCSVGATGTYSKLRSEVSATLTCTCLLPPRFEKTWMPELPAAVEVAVYRIAQEALTNVVRHAHACRCDLRLALNEAAELLTLSIQDDGCGLSPLWDVVVGLTSMRERAEELVGTWTIEPVKNGGTRILARLPYVRAEPAGALGHPNPQGGGKLTPLLTT